MNNFELKARYPDLTQARQIAEKLGARFQWTHEQIDTYWQVSQGKLKLRQQPGAATQLIAYHRPQAAAKLSDYDIFETTGGEHLRKTLSKVLVTDVQIRKTRTLYLWNNVRIHLDDVPALGSFIEFEVVMSGIEALAKAKEKIEFLQKLFAIAAEDLIECGYYELTKSLKEQTLA